jgi:hypothetical protein
MVPQNADAVSTSIITSRIRIFSMGCVKWLVNITDKMEQKLECRQAFRLRRRRITEFAGKLHDLINDAVGGRALSLPRQALIWGD